MGRYEAEELYEDEYEADERTRAAVSGVPSYDDQFEDRTRSARESYVALEGLERSGARRASGVAASEIARRSFVAPAEIEGDRSPAMRARRQSFVDPSELIATPARPSFASAASARDVRASAPEIPPPSPRRSQIPRSERPVSAPGPLPAPPTPRASRHSYVASSERGEFASSVDADEVTTYRPISQRPAALSQPVGESTYAPVIESTEIEEVAAAPEERSRPVDYDALKRYLFDDVPPSSPQAAAMSPEDRSVSMQTPVAAIGPRATHKAFRPAMHSIHPNRAEIAPAARISHNAFRPQMHSQMPAPASTPNPTTAPLAPAPFAPFGSVPAAARISHNAFRPQMPMNAPVQQDSYVDSSWIVPTPPFPSNAQPMRETATFKVTLSFVAAAMTAVAALAVMIGAILFIRSEDAPTAPTTTVAHAPAAAEMLPKAAMPVQTSTPVQTPLAAPVQTATAEKVAAPEKIAPTEKVVVSAKVADAKPSETKLVETKPAEAKPVETKPATKKKAPAVAQSDDDDEEAPAPAPKPAKKASKTAADKSVEQMLAELGEEQLRR
jgi:hypothetical protein